MNILIDINHPAHVHFFRHPIAILKSRGHNLLVTSRVKEVAVPLLDELKIEHRTLSVQKKGGGLPALALELIRRDTALFRVARQFRPDAMAAIGGTFVAHVGFLARIPSIVFYDTENATLQNAITYPLASSVVVPRCYQAWTPRSARRYDGYHELSYLRPGRFVADLQVAIQNGLQPSRDNFFIRTVSWHANHDVGEVGWNERLLTEVASYLSGLGAVHISSEAPLPKSLEQFCYRGKVSDVHHVMHFCRLFIGESATMASECAVMGVPAIYAAHTGRGYTDEQEQRYGLVTNIRKLQFDVLRDSIDRLLVKSQAQWKQQQELLLGDTIDVAQFVADTVEAAAKNHSERGHVRN